MSDHQTHEEDVLQRCWPWSHQWTRWETEDNKLYKPYGILPMYQGRFCLRCGLYKTRSTR